MLQFNLLSIGTNAPEWIIQKKKIEAVCRRSPVDEQLRLKESLCLIPQNSLFKS
jgi:hypothetical protein